MKIKDIIVVAALGGVCWFAYQMLQEPKPETQRVVKEENVFTPMTSTMGRAQNVQTMDLDRKAEMDAAIDAQE